MMEEQNVRRETPAQPGYVETFNNREVRWSARAGAWEVTPEGVRAAPGRVAGWYVCRAVRPPDYVTVEATLSARDVSAGPTAAAAVSIITDQGHRAMSAVFDPKNRRLILMGTGSSALARAQMPESLNPEADHHLVLRRNGPQVTAELDGVAVSGRLHRSITQGLLAFWTDPGVEAVFRRVSMARAFREEAPYERLPEDWEPSEGDEGEWMADNDGIRFTGNSGLLVKGAGLWEDVQVSARVRRPGKGGATGIGLRGQMQGLITFAVTEGDARLVWDEGGGRESVPLPATVGERPVLTLRRLGRTAYLWVDGAYLGAHEVPSGPADAVLAASGPATYECVSVNQWI